MFAQNLWLYFLKLLPVNIFLSPIFTVTTCVFLLPCSCPSLGNGTHQSPHTRSTGNVRFSSIDCCCVHFSKWAIFLPFPRLTETFLQSSLHVKLMSKSLVWHWKLLKFLSSRCLFLTHHSFPNLDLLQFCYSLTWPRRLYLLPRL